MQLKVFYISSIENNSIPTGGAGKNLDTESTFSFSSDIFLQDFFLV